MSEKFRNIAIGLSFIIVAIAIMAFTYTAIQNNRQNNKIEAQLAKDRADCLREGDNAGQFNDWGYNTCMRYKGYPNEIRNN